MVSVMVLLMDPVLKVRYSYIYRLGYKYKSSSEYVATLSKGAYI